MHKTSTLPKKLIKTTDALTEHSAEDLLFHSPLLDLLTEELDEICESPKASTVANILAYSKAVEVKVGQTMTDDQVIVLN
jgi:hypothetical protein